MSYIVRPQHLWTLLYHLVKHWMSGPMLSLADSIEIDESSCH